MVPEEGFLDDSQHDMENERNPDGDLLQKKGGRPIIKPIRRDISSPLEAELDLGGEYHFLNMRNSSLSAEKKVNQIWLDEFTIREDVKTLGQLHGYDYSRGFDLGNGEVLSTVSKRGYGGFVKHSWRILKRHLFNMQIRKKLFKSIREISMFPNKDEFNQERMRRRVARIHRSKIPIAIAEMDSVDYGGQETCLHWGDTCRVIR